MIKIYFSTNRSWIQLTADFSLEIAAVVAGCNWDAMVVWSLPKGPKSAMCMCLCQQKKVMVLRMYQYKNGKKCCISNIQPHTSSQLLKQICYSNFFLHKSMIIWILVKYLIRAKWYFPYFLVACAYTNVQKPLWLPKNIYLDIIKGGRGGGWCCCSFSLSYDLWGKAKLKWWDFWLAPSAEHSRTLGRSKEKCRIQQFR